jgi:hypothetical protein
MDGGLTMRGVAEYRYWSPVLGCEAARISGFDDRGGEFFMIIPVDEAGKKYRHARQSAAEAIGQAISLGLHPGEVRTQ